MLLRLKVETYITHKRGFRKKHKSDISVIFVQN